MKKKRQKYFQNIFELFPIIQERERQREIHRERKKLSVQISATAYF
jgi:ERCC4-type nuclease